MDFARVKKLVEDNYKIKVDRVNKRKNVYKITAGFREYCLKVINYEFEHFYFILSAIKHLESNGFKGTPKIISTLTGRDYVKFEDKFAYFTEWIDAKEADYDIMRDLIATAKRVRELHKCSRGFTITAEMKPRLAWGKWDKVFATRLDEILGFNEVIKEKSKKTEFDILFSSVLEEELNRGERAIVDLKNSTYYEYMAREVMELGFCHHDLAHHNILFNKRDEVNIIDFDYCILDSHLHDLASLCMRAMRNGKWSVEKFDEITKAYSDDGKGLTKDEEQIVLSFLEFPQDYWQVGLQYYFEEQPWSDERFMTRLGNYIKDRKGREAFIEELRARSK
ncbi:MAG: CotS family spore coat protein [Sarcina sp.]